MERDSHTAPEWCTGADVAVVALGAAVRADGQASAAMRRRVRAAAALAQATPGARLVLSGGAGKRHPAGVPSEARLMAALAVQVGATPACLLLEERSSNTLGNAAHSLAVLARHGLPDRVVVVTDRPHLRRALWCFRAVARARGLPVHIEGVGVPIPDRRAARSLAVREAFALLLYLPRLLSRASLVAPEAGGHDDGPA
ncbi:YdcF family protein [Roseospira goensis]|uniref:Uncharacterized SAM-binding protein YcdF (DUF218 family) n=1 Tax=Roseospira goensis TaxID=391922 RepID=A0A7W6RX35_9PROT|nr:YdcF family protein [Roseospira goensis]MBB4284811.1 uncharacterized SAM-binding protein YcdF (DUF218 family) [Roseospira goensis]